MSGRELIALGTSSQVPTRERSQNSYLLRWDGEGFLFDPGEGTQRQLTLAGISVCAIHNICITHFHGDHCLGLPGVLQRLALEGCGHPIHVYFPESGYIYCERLRDAAVYHPKIEMIMHPVSPLAKREIELKRTDKYTLKSHPLEHTVQAIGFRLEESAGIRFIPEKLSFAGVYDSMVGELKRKGWVKAGDRVVRLEEVTRPRAGNIFSFIMDTKPCSGAVTLAGDADLVVMEATYASEHGELADRYYHSTAKDAAITAKKAGAHRLALTHFSQRYSSSKQHLEDAREIFAEVTALNDLDIIEIPRRS